jgi:hypothetical protein
VKFTDVLKGIGKQYVPAYQAATDFKKGGGGWQEFSKDVQKDAATAMKMAAMGGFLHGGKVKKRGLYKLHEGERVLNKKQARKWEHS